MPTVPSRALPSIVVVHRSAPGMTKSLVQGGKIRDVLRFSSSLLVWHSAGADAALLTVASS